MARCLFVFILILWSHSSIYAQKSHRAAKAMNELKFDKSIELFEDILKKDSNEVNIYLFLPVIFSFQVANQITD